MSADDIPN